MGYEIGLRIKRFVLRADFARLWRRQIQIDWYLLMRSLAGTQQIALEITLVQHLAHLIIRVWQTCLIGTRQLHHSAALIHHRTVKQLCAVG
ncbi:hypothetical protein D3C77_536810 [compost metagenome]